MPKGILSYPKQGLSTSKQRPFEIYASYLMVHILTIKTREAKAARLLPFQDVKVSYPILSQFYVKPVAS